MADKVSVGFSRQVLCCSSTATGHYSEMSIFTVTHETSVLSHIVFNIVNKVL